MTSICPLFIWEYGESPHECQVHVGLELMQSSGDVEGIDAGSEDGNEPIKGQSPI